ncbi:WxL domain-containing protein [Enterococcus faecalis]|uniref:WxL domain-containing protein n=1 Tax=Enterococcus TaxID=1350 RepID=UPI000DE80867|nr:WxL domain-containing protein [Enterococcus faecalis]EGO8274685.1 WxL domain-containing protein [Enterococcus faecalis]EGO9002159.1 WxL domain-containing protein [Enterococcus faecalis]MDB1623712.1 WxL domain-containing protein [Enterococcus faecalis]NSW12120.1 WxL domain-containing protein [Enterococcus faecalis]RBR45998.1 hypothetical protein EB28_01519 [Enterococcus faecalis]
MKKKILASLLVGSAVVGASLSPLSAQATTTGKTPVTVGIEGGSLENQEDNGNGTSNPDPNESNTDFDLLNIPTDMTFSTKKITDDTSAIPIRAWEYTSPTGPAHTYSRFFSIGDVRGTKEGWHVTAQIPSMTSKTDTLQGAINFTQTGGYAVYNSETKVYQQSRPGFSSDPSAPIFSGTSITIGTDASLMVNAGAGKGQGLWTGELSKISLNITTPTPQLAAGAYTGNITWNLVAGPSI